MLWEENKSLLLCTKHCHFRLPQVRREILARSPPTPGPPPAGRCPPGVALSSGCAGPLEQPARDLRRAHRWHLSVRGPRGGRAGACTLLGCPSVSPGGGGRVVENQCPVPPRPVPGNLAEGLMCLEPSLSISRSQLLSRGFHRPASNPTRAGGNTLAFVTTCGNRLSPRKTRTMPPRKA